MSKELKSLMVKTKEEAEALGDDYVLSFKEVLKETPKKRAPRKTQPKLEV